jgi:VWFA-related protein
MRLRAIALLAVATGMTGVAQGQETGSGRTVIRTETRVVLVDAVVTDKKGNYVPDLTAKDFRVWEDNKEQAITNAVSQAEEPAKAQQKGGLILLFDNTTMSSTNQAQAKKAALGMLELEGAADRLTAVAAYNGTVGVIRNFTTDTEQLKQAIAKVPPASVTGATDARSFLYALAVFARSVAAVPGRKTVVFFTGGHTLGTRSTDEFQAAMNACNRANLAIYPVDVVGLGAAGGALGRTEGEWAGLLSHVGVALAAGPVLRIASFMMASGQQTVGQATRSTGAPATTATTPPPASIPGRQGGVAMGAYGFMTSLADSTGGFVVRNSNDLLEGLQKILKEERAYYLLSYTPPESSKGGCHTLRVKVSRGGTTVRSRSSYCYSKPADILAGTPAERELQGRLAGSEAGAAAASLQAPFFYSAPDTARVNLTMEIPSSGIRFEKVKGKLHAEVNVLAIAYRDDQVAARTSDVVKLDFNDQAAVDAFKQKPLHYENQFEITPGKYNLKVAFGQTGGAFGKLESALAIDAYDGQRLAISALTFSRQTRPAQDASSADAALMEGRTPLVARDVEYIPSGENRFPQGERFRVYFELYDPQLLSGASSVTARMATFDKKTGRQMSGLDMGNVSGYARPGTNTIAIGITMPALPPGSYRAELQAASAGAGSAARPVEFDVNN